MTTRRRIGRSPQARPQATTHRSVHAHCRWCPAEVMWLESSATGKLAPIDTDPVPGGNVLVHRDTAGRVLGTYSVIGAEERGLFDATEAVDADARPTLHLNHWATCTSPTARRLARERSRGKTGPVVAVEDGAPVGEVDKLAPPAAVRAARGCAVCGTAMDPQLLEAEPATRTHPTCDKET